MRHVPVQFWCDLALRVYIQSYHIIKESTSHLAFIVKDFCKCIWRVYLSHLDRWQCYLDSRACPTFEKNTLHQVAWYCTNMWSDARKCTATAICIWHAITKVLSPIDCASWIWCRKCVSNPPFPAPCSSMNLPLKKTYCLLMQCKIRGSLLWQKCQLILLFAPLTTK